MTATGACKLATVETRQDKAGQDMTVTVNSPGDDVLSDGLGSAGAMVTTMTTVVIWLYVLERKYDVTTV
ncbi:hypothetical protein RRF57_004633 [Xylaria bambusicola]|uniref:Uncharacterized protein n=1 Tax=Xylaria bambusicola TaxID=326684 RepID=A0AAN7UGR9_9PEZI